MYGAFGIRPLAVVVLLRPGGDIDQFFAHTGTAAGEYTADLYSTGGAGDVINNYFLTNLEKRGLINSSAGPALPHFPYYEDALAIYTSTHKFMTSFVNSYYTSDSAIVNDAELQNWMTEANGPAGAVNFPTSDSMKTRAALIDLLTHMAHIVSTAHHTVNTNNLITGGGVLPFNPSGLYKPIPTAKGVTNVAQYLIGVDQVLNLIENQAFFSRPLVANSNRTVSNMFNDPVMLGRMNSATRTANTLFMSEMDAQSSVVRSKQFDSNGLSQGMPFIWRTLDPNVIPFTLTI
ncbi:Lipoxygenase-4 [Arthrobotrys entomopaga]|nr:Lipoxygenase-4 [Arthrobotrys entomopaga]